MVYSYDPDSEMSRFVLWTRREKNQIPVLIFARDDEELVFGHKAYPKYKNLTRW